MSQPCMVYVRISSDRTGDEAGVTRQRQDCLKLAEQRGYSVVSVETDNDTSATRSKRRDGFENVLSAVAAGSVSAVVAWNFDRIAKTRRDTWRLIETCQEHKVTLALVRGADLDMATPGGRLIADLFSSVARAESDIKSDRQRRANRQRAEQGLPHVARRAFGYNPDGMTINEDEAELIRQMVSKFLSGWTVRDIVRWLNGDGHTSTMGKQFTIKVVKDHLTSKRNAGLRHYDGQDYPAVWQPIIDRETHERVLAEMERRKVKTKTPQARRYLLTGLVFCGRCDQAMVGHAKKDPSSDIARPKYVCPEYPHGKWCGNNTRLAAPLEHLVKEAIIYRLDSQELTQLLSQDVEAEDLEPLRKKQTELSGRLDELVDALADGTLNKQQFARAKRRVTSELESVEAELSALYSSQDATRLLSAAQSVREAWEQGSQGWRRQLMGLLIEKIVVHPSRLRPLYYVDGERYRFDVGSIELAWKY